MSCYKNISIAMTTCNGEAYIAQQLDSIAAQTVAPIEIVICDDASTDSTLNIIGHYSKQLPIHLYKNNNRLGVVKNFRKAISMCKGEWVACCDQDDVWLPNKLALSSEAMESVDSDLPTLVFTDLIVVNANLDLIAGSYWAMRNIKPNKETFYSLLFGNIVTGCSMMMNRSMSQEIGKIPDNAIMHDYWAAYIAYSWGKYKYLSQQTVLYRQHLNNVTQNDKVNTLSRFINLIQFVYTGFDNFLTPEIEQAELFKNYYLSQLSPENLEDLNKYISFKKNHPSFRKLYAYFLKK